MPAQYDTPNGPKTIDQMRAELGAAGYNGPTDDATIIAKYNETAGGAGRAAGGGSTGNPAQDLLDAIATGNRDKFDEAIRQFDELLKLDQAKFDEQVRQFNEGMKLQQQNAWSALATTLLGTAASLTGPQDWRRYQEYTSGGKDIFGALYGSNALPTTAAPTGVSQPKSIVDLLGDLGITLPDQGQASAPTAPPTQVDIDAALDFIWQARPDLKGFYEGNGWDVSTPQGQRAAVMDWVTKAAGQSDLPGGARDPLSVAKALGYQPPAPTPAPTPTPAPVQQPGVAGQPSSPPAAAPGRPGAPAPPAPAPWPSPSGSVGIEPPSISNPTPFVPPAPAMPWDATIAAQGPASTAPPTVANPNSISPAVWDSLSPTAQAMILGSAQAGDTPSGYWDPNDFMRVLNAGRPKGSAGGLSIFDFGKPRGF